MRGRWVARLGWIGRLPWRATFLSAVLVFLLLELAFAGGALTETGCTLCHEPAAAAERHKQTVHAEVGCMRCHRPEGYLSWPIMSVQAAGNLLAQLDPRTNGSPQVAAVSERCIDCHSEAVAGVVLSTDSIKMSHAEPLAAGLACTDCHATETHAQAAVLLKRDHSTCADCHDGTRAASECATCHASDPGRERDSLPGQEALVHGPNWERTHAMGEMASCRTCHKGKDCARCHEIELPHSPTSWPQLHGKESLRVGKNACTSCHQSDFCDSCHSMSMPHPTAFLGAHASEAKARGEAVCEGCHVKESCTNCHVKHVHPGVRPEVLDELRRSS